MEDFIDVSGAPLAKGDKVAVQYQQAFRIGRIVGFRKKKVVVEFDFSANGNENPNSMERAQLCPWKMAKVANQNCSLHEYFKVYCKYNNDDF